MLQYIILWCIILIYSIKITASERDRSKSPLVLRQQQLIVLKKVQEQEYKKLKKEALLLGKFLDHDQENQPTKKEKQLLQKLLQNDLLKK